MITILLTIYVTLGAVCVARELTKPYGGSVWMLDFLLGPYFLISDFIHEYKMARKLEGPKPFKRFMILIPIVFLFLSCGKEVALNGNFIIVDNVRQNDDGSFEINLKAPASSGTTPEVHFTSKFRFQAGDTLWSKYQLKEYNINKITEAYLENKSLKDSLQVVNIKLQKMQLENELLKNHYLTTLQSGK